MNGFMEWCQSNAVSHFMRSAKWPYPSVEVLHIAGLILVFGSMLILNLRILGRILRQEPVPQVAAGLLTEASHVANTGRSLRPRLYHRPNL